MSLSDVLGDPQVAREKREQMLRDGYCAIENVVPPEMIEELRDHEHAGAIRVDEVGVEEGAEEAVERRAEPPARRVRRGGGRIGVLEQRGREGAADLHRRKPRMDSVG